VLKNADYFLKECAFITEIHWKYYQC